MTDLIVLGASARAAVHSAQRAGLACHAIDLFADSDLEACATTAKITDYPRDFLTALAAAPSAPWIYTGGLENHPRLVAQLAGIRPLRGNSATTLRGSRDPQRLAVAAREAGCPLPASEGKQLLVKPRRGSAGLGIRFATPQDLVSPPRGCYLQEFLTGQSASAVFVGAARQARLLGVTQQWLGCDFALPQPFQYVGSLGPLDLSAPELAALVHLGSHLAVRFSLVGLFNIDFLRADGMIRPVEVNPRYSASVEVLERALGHPALPLHLAACAGNLPPAWPTLSPERYCGKAVVYANEECVVSRRVAECWAPWNQPGQPPPVADLPRLGDRIAAQQPVLTVFAEAYSLSAVAAELRVRIAALQSALSR